MKKIILTIVIAVSVNLAFSQSVNQMMFKQNLKESGNSLKSSQQCILVGITLIGVGTILAANRYKYNDAGAYCIAGGCALIFTSHLFIVRSGNKLKEASQNF